MKDCLKANSFLWFVTEEIIGIHDYEQFYVDIYRKSFIQAKKHFDQVKNMLSEWEEKAKHDQDFWLAIKGFNDGVNFKENVAIDAAMNSTYKDLIKELNITKKESGEIDLNNYAGYLISGNDYIAYKKTRKAKVVIYTAISGHFDDLIQHTYISKDFDYVCFTDQQISDPGIWEIRPLEDRGLDRVRSAKYYKVSPDKFFADYDYSVWIDGNIDVLNDELEVRVKQLIKNETPIAASKHFERDCIYEEANMCILYGVDDPEVIERQMDFLRREGFPERQGLFEMNIIYRNHQNLQIASLMQAWWEMIVNYSRRDQLSFMYVLWKNEMLCDHMFDTNTRLRKSFSFNAHNKLFYPSLHIDTGNGFENNNTFIQKAYTSKGNKLDVNFLIDKGESIKKIIFTPVYNRFCAFKIEEIATDGVANQVCSSNRTFSSDGWDYFFTNKPMYFIEGDFVNAAQLSIKGQIRLLTASEISQEIEQKNQEIEQKNQEIAIIKNSRTWKVANRLRHYFRYVIPKESIQERFVKFFWNLGRGHNIKKLRKKQKVLNKHILDNDKWIDNCNCVLSHREAIDIVVCVHNAHDDVTKCLDSVKLNSREPYSLIIVDDGSAERTEVYLKKFASSMQNCTLIRNERPLGYTYAANIGMRHSKASYLILLNSDTIVSVSWLDRLYRAMIRDKHIGIVGPLSNTASWQSVPKLNEAGDWAVNKLPNGLSVSDMSKWISNYSACIHPEVPLLNGFCLMIRRKVIADIGCFDEVSFGQGYGEEDDFILRAAKAGWKKVIADDVFIYHSQSKSYTNEKRYALQSISGKKLLKKHGARLIDESVDFMQNNRVMDGIRSRIAIIEERERIIAIGRNKFEGKRILFLLPVIDPGGGANVVVDESVAMRRMGVDVTIFNLNQNKIGFANYYPHIDIPVIYADIKELPKISLEFDVVIATAHYSVTWMLTLQNLQEKVKLAYYIQGFEPLIYHKDSNEYKQALDSYTRISNMICFTKTDWTSKTVYKETGIKASSIGISVNTDLFRPRDQLPYGAKPVTMTAMIRPASLYRNPELTIRVLKDIAMKHGNNVDIWLFGSDDIRDVMDPKDLSFKWKQLGKLTQHQVASVLSKADIFIDLSEHQAMGLTALEAMACGCAVIVPQNGGAVEFVSHGTNGIVVDTSGFELCCRALDELVKDDKLRQQLQKQAIKDVVNFYTEKPAYQILDTLFCKL